MLLVIFKKYFNTLLCPSKILNEFLVRLLALINLRLQSLEFTVKLSSLSFCILCPRHSVTATFCTTAYRSTIFHCLRCYRSNSHDVSSRTRSWVEWFHCKVLNILTPVIFTIYCRTVWCFFIRFSIYSCSNSFKCSFSNLLESLATKHPYVTSTSVLNSDKFL